MDSPLLSVFLCRYPVAKNLAPVRSQYALWMELYAVDIVFLVAQCHDLSFITFCGNLQTIGEIILRYNPRMVTAHGDATGKSVKNSVVPELGSFGGYPMEHIGKIS